MACNDKKKRIIRVVEKLAAKQTLHEITLDEVAKQAKIGKGTIYHYFKDKEDLLFEVATSGFDELCELLKQEIPHNASFTLKFYNMCNHIIQFFTNRLQLLRIMQTHASCTCWSKRKVREKWTSKRKQLVDIVSDVLSEGVVEEIIRSDLSTDFLATSLLGMLRAYVRDSDISSDSTQKSELLVDLFLNGAFLPRNSLTADYSKTLQEDKSTAL